MTLLGPTTGSPSLEDEDSSDDSEISDILDLRNDEGWEDVEKEDVTELIVSLFDDEVFPNVLSMLEYCKNKYDFDFINIKKKFELDFYGTIKLVNYIRSEVKAGTRVSSNISKSDFEDEAFLKPVLEDDCLLFSLDDLSGAAIGDDGLDNETVLPGSTNLLARIAQLEEELKRSQTQFSDYRATVKQTLDGRWNDSLAGLDVNADVRQEKLRDDDSHYFTSYSYNDIHETMLKDTIRTDAYRDFIYDNKSLFAGKVVLDVGCGTGILSLFCAKAGALRVIAVDNSAIIDKARENVFNNGLSDKITCLRGKIEEVTLPLEKVDIIVSEWMGYCLLYEAMLDSVIWARDKYLKPNGLMVPSHINMWVAPIADPDYVADHFSFWRDVYGFDMKSMQAGIHDDVHVLHMPVDTLCSEPFPFRQLRLHSTSAQELVFKCKWEAVLTKDIEALDGFVVWFDTFFMPSRNDEVPRNADAGSWGKMGKGVAFTTGPHGKETHWRQGLMFIDNGEKAVSYWKDENMGGELEYAVADDNSRALNLTFSWATKSAAGPRSQSWKMR